MNNCCLGTAQRETFWNYCWSPKHSQVRILLGGSIPGCVLNTLQSLSEEEENILGLRASISIFSFHSGNSQSNCLKHFERHIPRAELLKTFARTEC